MKFTTFLVSGLLALSLTAHSGQADSLKSAVQTALTSNPQLKAADANFRALTYDLLYSEAGFQPTVRLFGDLGSEYVDDPQGLSAADNKRAKFNSQLGVVAELTLFDGYARANRVYAAAARVDQSSFELLDASETMALMVSEQYINIARQQRLLAVAQQNLRRLQNISRQAGTLVEGGRLPASDRIQIQAGIYSAQATIADIQRRLTESLARYKRLVGKSAHANFPLPPPVRPGASMERYVAESVSNSYRVRIAGSNVEVREYEQGIAEADYAPQLTLNAGASLGNNLDGSRGSERRAFVGVGLSWQLYGGKRNARRMGLSERKNEALYQRMAVVREVEELASIAWNAFQMNMIRSEYLASEVRSYQGMVNSYNREFELATRNVLDLLVAENRLYNARFEQVNAAAILSYSGFRALAAQSKLAKYFGVKNSNRVMATQIAARQGQKPLEVIRKGRLLLDK
ncbi:MAG: adhesin transport system outer membrane protein [Sulfitobacter sp.]|jgi:adhesin transport system outer membrane protein